MYDLGSESYEFSANVWNWKAAVEIIKSLDIIDDSKIRQMGYNAMGIKIDADDAQLIAKKIRTNILPQLEPNKRMFSDLSITDEPDDGTIYRDEDEQWKTIVLATFGLRIFLSFANGLKVFRYSEFRPISCLDAFLFSWN